MLGPPSPTVVERRELLYAYIDETGDRWPGGPRDIKVRFGHVRGFNHSVTLDYLAKKRRRQNGTPWHLLRKIQFPGASQYDGLQAADQYGGLLTVAKAAWGPGASQSEQCRKGLAADLMCSPRPPSGPRFCTHNTGNGRWAAILNGEPHQLSDGRRVPM